MSGANPNRAGRPEKGGPKKVLSEEMAEAKKMPIGGWLLVLNGKHKGEDFRLREGKNLVGSDPTSEVHLEDEHISAKHASINCKRASDTSGSFQVVDLDSTNHTFHNGSEEPTHATELVDNDIIAFGTTKCKFKCT